MSNVVSLPTRRGSGASRSALLADEERLAIDRVNVQIRSWRQALAEFQKSELQLNEVQQALAVNVSASELSANLESARTKLRKRIAEYETAMKALERSLATLNP